MADYYQGITKQSKIIDGYRVNRMNFYGKAPSLFADDSVVGHWNRFQTRAENTAEDLIALDKRPEFVVGYWEEGCQVAYWNGKAVYSDMYWERYGVGTLRNVGTESRKKWVIDFKEGYDPKARNFKEINPKAFDF